MEVMALRPLDGFVVGVTADRRWQEQAELLERRGAVVVHGPTIDTLYLASDQALREATLDVIERPPDYLVATTGIGVRAWFEAASTWGLVDRLTAALQPARAIARGPKAAGAVATAGLDVWSRSPSERMDELLELLLAEPLDGRRVILQEYGMRTPQFTEALTAAGAEVVEVPVYRWRVPGDHGPALRLVEAACEGRVDAVTFTSAPAVHNLFSIAATKGADDQLRRAFNTGSVLAACVGPVCAEGAREEGIEAPLAPSVGRLGLLVRALSEQLESRRRTFRCGGVVLAVQGSAVEVDGDVAELAPRERAVFELLASRPGAVVPRGTLLEKVWGSPAADPHVLDVTVARLRRRLGPCGAALHTAPGRGYRLVLDEEVATAP